ncbi:hypothetical protein MPC4_80168 [Methylocella tundrae]|uniref:Uncharacterized protein n=1 Tax=Methylocella tundrae TaxID=227605 RepID=A0A8B6MBT4_METTU|nr:gpW family head-tail joining protein [Methylocella tundrae]VTZ27893.1 hypothetical protein MPC1_70003 [Methylocella tundrae]VTZ52497.1 hypothetical protein MPC4_80168 [Methylocella tundrae]
MIQQPLTLEQMLCQAQAVLHLRQMGKSANEIIADGYVAKYTRITIPELMAYISQLRAQIAGAPTIGAINTIWSR